MQTITAAIKDRARALLEAQSVDAVLGWWKGSFSYDPTPAMFRIGDLDNLVYNGFCAGNLSKYLIGVKESRVLALLKPCDTYSLNQLLRERRVVRNKVYALGLGCDGMLDIVKIRARGIKGILSIVESGDELRIDTIYGEHSCPREAVLLEKCQHCKGKEHMIYDELIGAEDSRETKAKDRMEAVSHIEAMTPAERFAFWNRELSQCIRCNACRNVCPVCTCVKCIFDNRRLGIDSQANANSYEESLYHIIRAFHVAGRCTDCGECSRVCPQEIPLHLLNRKYIKDINEFYGDFQAGAESEGPTPLTSFERDDVEPDAHNRGGGAQ